MEADLPELFVRVGEAAKAAGKAWSLLIDEVQYLRSKDLAALIVALHKVNQRDLPVLFFGAGLPQVAALSGDDKSYAERLFHYPAVGALGEVDAETAIRQPIEGEGEEIDDNAIVKLGRAPLLVAADPYRPAAADQLEAEGLEVLRVGSAEAALERLASGREPDPRVPRAPLRLGERVVFVRPQGGMFLWLEGRMPFDPKALFAAAVQAKCAEMLPDALFEIELTGSVRDQLKAIGEAFFALITSEEAISIHRIMSRQLPEDSHLPKMFWEAGPKRTQESFANFLRAEAEAGQLRITDFTLAASQFFCLLKGEYHARLLCGCPERYDGDQVQRHVESTVDMFLRAYGHGPRSA